MLVYVISSAEVWALFFLVLYYLIILTGYVMGVASLSSSWASNTIPNRHRKAKIVYPQQRQSKYIWRGATFYLEANDMDSYVTLVFFGVSIAPPHRDGRPCVPRVGVTIVPIFSSQHQRWLALPSAVGECMWLNGWPHIMSALGLLVMRWLWLCVSETWISSVRCTRRRPATVTSVAMNSAGNSPRF